MALGGQEPRILVLGDGFGELPEHSRAGYRASQEVTAGNNAVERKASGSQLWRELKM